MTVQWLLQGNHPNLTTIAEIEKVLLEQGCSVHRIGLQPRTLAMPDVDMLDTNLPVICYGPSFVPRAFGNPLLSPGIFFDPETFRWSSFASGWGDLMISSGAVLTSAGEAAAVVGTKTMFVRPDEDSKAFDGAVLDGGMLAGVLDQAFAKGHILHETPVVVAPVTTIDAEWRTFVVDGEVVAASSYRVDGDGTVDFFVPREVIEMAFDAAAAWTPADVFCLDIARSDGRYGIIEANCFNASRFYGADARAILAAVSEHAGTRFIAGQTRSPR